MHDYPLKQRTIGHLLADKARRVGDSTWLIFGDQRCEPERWLVEEKQAGSAHQRAPDRQHLLLATR